MIVALAGGVGGAKLAAGLASILPPGELTVAVNTGDDFEHLGLRICPDVDTVMYTLAGIANAETGWGQTAETWSFMESLERLGGPTWFRLGDRDLATHVERTRRLDAGESLSDVTRALCQRLGIRHAVVPMSDAPVPTIIHSAEGPLEFQDYFVRRRCAPRVQRIEYRQGEAVSPSRALADALARPDLQGIVICPSNPWLSIGPILAIAPVRQALQRAKAVVAVSPLIAGQAVKGPTAKIMRELGLQPSALEIARFYDGLISALIVDRADASLVPDLTALGLAVAVEETLMKSNDDRIRVARACLAQCSRIPA